MVWLFLLFFFSVDTVKADLAIQEEKYSQCSLFEKEEYCEFNKCSDFENNSQYRKIGVGTFPPREIYCYRNPDALFTNLLNFVQLVIPYTLITIILEVFILFLFGFRTKNAILTISLVNLLTNPLANFIIYSFKFSFEYILFLEVIVIFLEAIIYKKTLIKTSFRKSLLISLSANIISAIGGLIIIRLIPALFRATMSLFK